MLVAPALMPPPVKADIFVTVGTSATNTGVMKFNDDGTGGKLLFTTGTDTAPRGLTIGPDGALYVCFSGTGNINRYDSNTGALLGAFVARGKGGLQAPITPRFANNLLYVTDFGENSPPVGGPFGGQVLRYNLNGSFKDQLIGPTSTFPGIVSAYGLDFDFHGNLNVSMANGDRATDADGNPGYGCVLGYTPTGAFIDITANNPNDPYFSGSPPDIAFAGIGFSLNKQTLYAALPTAVLGSSNIGAVGIYDYLTYDVITYIGADGIINAPLAVEVNPVDGNLWIVSTGGGTVDVYSYIPPYNHLRSFAGGLAHPADVAFRQLLRLKPSFNPVTAGRPVPVALLFSAPAGSGGMVVKLQSSNPAIATVPASVTVPAGKSTYTFNVNTLNQAKDTTVTISGSYSGTTQQLNLNVITNRLSGFTLVPTTVAGGSSVTGTVTLWKAAPAGGYTVALTSNSTDAVVPVGVTVAAGSKSATFTVTTGAITGADKIAVINASFGGFSHSVKLTITP
jgi:hypothetical protein